MERTYDIFEKMSDGSMMWRAAISGHEDALRKLKEMAAQAANEFHLRHLASNTLIATTNASKDEKLNRSALPVSHPRSE
jgi:hypothetical protein